MGIFLKDVERRRQAHASPGEVALHKVSLTLIVSLFAG